MKKIYIVDDDKHIIESVSMVLKSAGYEVGSQTDDRNVVDKVKAFGPNLIILDVMFPENEGAGFEMARELRQSPSTASIPILMLSAVNERELYPGKFSNEDRDASWLPVQEFVEKPIDPKSLLEKVKELCN